MPPTRKQIACLAHEMLSQVDCTNPTFADLPFNLEWAARRDVTLAGNVVLVLGMYQEMMFLRLPEIFDENTTFQDTLETSKETLKQLHAKHPHGFDAGKWESFPRLFSPLTSGSQFRGNFRDDIVFAPSAALRPDSRSLCLLSAHSFRLARPFTST